MLNAGKDKIIFIYQSYFVFVPLFSKPILTRQLILSTKNSQEFLASQVSVLRRNKGTRPVSKSVYYLGVYPSDIWE